MNFLMKGGLKPSWIAIAQRMITTNSPLEAGSKWRLAQGLGKCGNEYGPLVETPDWSYADGRPSPIGFKENQRREKNEALARNMMKMMGELQDAKNLHEKEHKRKQVTKQKILDKKLKPKVKS